MVGALPSDSLLGILPGVGLVYKLQTTLVVSGDLHVVGILSTLYYNIRERERERESYQRIINVPVFWCPYMQVSCDVTIN